jgi:hypothetical protein
MIIAATDDVPSYRSLTVADGSLIRAASTSRRIFFLLIIHIQSAIAVAVAIALFLRRRRRGTDDRFDVAKFPMIDIP